ncbi:hypothetical protein [Spirulina sp. 06S082]|nr:hypothetical protein [Spirulina sp. 06S082]MEA5468355.1 hypothetical protein [Spirulina sp. 06S082]
MDAENFSDLENIWSSHRKISQKYRRSRPKKYVECRLTGMRDRG